MQKNKHTTVYNNILGDGVLVRSLFFSYFCIDFSGNFYQLACYNCDDFFFEPIFEFDPNSIASHTVEVKNKNIADN